EVLQEQLVTETADHRHHDIILPGHSVSAGDRLKRAVPALAVRIPTILVNEKGIGGFRGFLDPSERFVETVFDRVAFLAVAQGDELPLQSRGKAVSLLDIDRTADASGSRAEN